MKKKTVIITAVIVALLVGGTYWRIKKQTMQNGMGMSEFAVPVEMSPVLIEPLVNSVETVGTLKSNEGAIIKAEVSGRVVSVNFKEGSEVKAGDVLIGIDDIIYRAEFNQADAKFDLAKQSLQRAQELEKTGAITTKTLDEANANYRESEAALALAKSRFEKTSVKSPFNGIAGLRKVDIGDFLNIGDEIVNVEDISTMKVDFKVPEKYLEQVKNGQEISITIDALPDNIFTGEVLAFDPMIDTASRHISVRGIINNDEGLLRPGLFARVKMVLEKKEKAIMVPEQAIVPFGGQNFVYKVEEGKAKMLPIKIGLRVSGKVEIIEGLKDSDIIVTAGHMKIRDGASVVNIADMQKQQGSDTKK